MSNDTNDSVTVPGCALGGAEEDLRPLNLMWNGKAIKISWPEYWVSSVTTNLLRVCQSKSGQFYLNGPENPEIGYLFPKPTQIVLTERMKGRTSCFPSERQLAKEGQAHSQKQED